MIREPPGPKPRCSTNPLSRLCTEKNREEKNLIAVGLVCPNLPFITAEALASDCIVLIQKQDWHLSAATNTCTTGSQPNSHTQHSLNAGSTSWMSILLILNAYPTTWMHNLQFECIPCGLNAYPPMTPNLGLSFRRFAPYTWSTCSLPVHKNLILIGL